MRRRRNVDCTDCANVPPPLLPDNETAWRLWGLVQTQWRVGWSLVGLDYPAVLAVAALHKIDVTPELFSRIQALEMDVLQEQNKRTKE